MRLLRAVIIRLPDLTSAGVAAEASANCRSPLCCLRLKPVVTLQHQVHEVHIRTNSSCSQQHYNKAQQKPVGAVSS